MKNKWIYGIGIILIFGLCVLIVLVFSRQPFIRGIIGDFLVVFLIYFFFRLILPKGKIFTAVATLTIAWTVEFLQLLGLIQIFGLENYDAAKLILGAVFDPLDLAAYTTGTALVLILDWFLFSRLNFRKM